MSDSPLIPPAAKDEQERLRIEHTRLAHRILYGDWSKDLEKRIHERKGSQIAAVWGAVDTSRNAYRAIYDSLAVQYDRPPILNHDLKGVEDIVSLALNDAGLWQLMSGVQRDTLALRELLIRADITQDGRLNFRKVFPHFVIATAADDKPDIPVRIEEQRYRINPLTQEGQWTYDILDIRDPNNPFFVVMDAEQEEDLTLVYLEEELSGDAYPYRSADGTPYLPYVLYHASKTGNLFDAFSNRGLIEGTLNIGILYTYFNHAMLNASHPQRVIAGGQIPTETLNGGDGTSIPSIPSDPAMIMWIQNILNDGVSQPIQFHQFGPGADPGIIIQAVAQYERGMLSTVGLNSADLLRVEGDPRSGFAVAVSRETQREVQKRFEPQFRKGDLELISKSVMLLNWYYGWDLPEDGYRIRYQAIPKSIDERKAIREEVLELLEVGLIDRVTAYQKLNDDITRTEAEYELAKIDAERAKLTPKEPEQEEIK